LLGFHQPERRRSLSGYARAARYEHSDSDIWRNGGFSPVDRVPGFQRVGASGRESYCYADSHGDFDTYAYCDLDPNRYCYRDDNDNVDADIYTYRDRNSYEYNSADRYSYRNSYARR
jgi:hypothetical protein